MDNIFVTFAQLLSGQVSESPLSTMMQNSEKNTMVQTFEYSIAHGRRDYLSDFSDMHENKMVKTTESSVSITGSLISNLRNLEAMVQVSEALISITGGPSNYLKDLSDIDRSDIFGIDLHENMMIQTSEFSIPVTRGLWDYLRDSSGIKENIDMISQETPLPSLSHLDLVNKLPHEQVTNCFHRTPRRATMSRAERQLALMYPSRPRPNSYRDTKNNQRALRKSKRRRRQSSHLTNRHILLAPPLPPPPKLDPYDGSCEDGAFDSSLILVQTGIEWHVQWVQDKVETHPKAN